jgi:16S rRNA (uracil1498-N3)-methyltransferase
MTLNAWLAAQTLPVDINARSARYLLSLRSGTQTLGSQIGESTSSATFLSGPEGGLSMAEEDAAVAKGFQPVSLGNRVLRAETAGLAALAALSLD